MLNLSVEKLELKAKNRGIKGMSIDKLLSILDKSEKQNKTKQKKNNN